MSVFNQMRVLIYRVNRKGLEIFLVNAGGDNWELPEGSFFDKTGYEAIALEPACSESGDSVKACAVEADWHDIPSIRKMLKEDVRLVKDQIWHMIPGIDKGGYFVMKEAVKKVLPPEQCAFLKELKDIITDKNQAKYI